MYKNISAIKNWSKDLKIKFVRLVAEFDPQKMASVLEAEMFPLDEALEICKKYGVAQSISTIQFKLGLYEEASDTLIQVELFLTVDANKRY